MKNIFMRNGGDGETARRLNPGSIIALLVLAVILVAATVSSYLLITDRIIESAIDNLQELSTHDEQAILSGLNHQWAVLDGIGYNLRQHNIQTTDELFEQLLLNRNMIDCLRILLLSDEGEMLGNMNISENMELLNRCREYGQHFIYRREFEDLEGHTEALVLGVELTPFTVEGRTFVYLICLMDIDSLADELRIFSFDGRGYASVIDADGNYIVRMSQPNSVENRDNFFTRFQQGKSDDKLTVEEISSWLQSRNTFSIRFTNADGDHRIITFMPMEETNWYFIMSVSRSVFEEQSRSMMKIVMWMLMAVVALITVGVLFIMRRRSLMLQQEIEHREELSVALEAAEQASRAKTTFLNNMSHDIRTPMNAIIGFTSLATANVENPPRVKDYLNKISQSSAHLLSLINDVLDMSRIESGKMHLDPKPENLPEILHYLRSIIQADIQAKNLSLTIDSMNVTHEDIVCDRLRLNQMLLNLVSNSIKYTPAGGSVAVRITEMNSPRPECASYRFLIRDTGIGMKPDFLKTIFEPFSRERNSTVSGIQGTGLGMAITKSIVDLMDGSIEVASEEGKGTSFTVDLTFEIPHDAPRRIGDIGELKGMRTLVVDDDGDSCLSVSRMLDHLGLRSEWSMSSIEALELIRKAADSGDPFRVIILDWRLPDITGPELARQIRDTVGDNVHIIVFSAYDWADISEQAAAVGIAEFISKPLFASELHSSLLRACAGEVPEKPSQKVEDYTHRFEGKRILLAEDNEFNREIALEILGNAGFAVDAAENGQIAFEMVRDSEPGYYDLVLMDVQMPVMGGYQATQAIRALSNPALAKIPIIAMTANAFEEDKRAALEAGMNGHLGKPIDVPLLMKVLSEIFETEDAAQK